MCVIVAYFFFFFYSKFQLLKLVAQAVFAKSEFVDVNCFVTSLYVSIYTLDFLLHSMLNVPLICSFLLFSILFFPVCLICFCCWYYYFQFYYYFYYCYYYCDGYHHHHHHHHHHNLRATTAAGSSLVWPLPPLLIAVHCAARLCVCVFIVVVCVWLCVWPTSTSHQLINHILRSWIVPPLTFHRRRLTARHPTHTHAR